MGFRNLFWAQRRGKREHQMKGYVAEQKVSDWQMNAWTLRACDIVWRVTSIKNFVD